MEQDIPVFKTKEEEVRYLLENMSEEEACQILIPYFKRPDTGEIDRDIASKITEIKNESYEAVKKANTIVAAAAIAAKSFDPEETEPGTPTKPGPIICKKCRRHAMTLTLNRGIKLISYYGKVLMDYGEDVKIRGNVFTYNCPFTNCKNKIDIVT